LLAIDNDPNLVGPAIRGPAPLRPTASKEGFTSFAHGRRQVRVGFSRRASGTDARHASPAAKRACRSRKPPRPARSGTHPRRAEGPGKGGGRWPLRSAGTGIKRLGFAKGRRLRPPLRPPLGAEMDRSVVLLTCRGDRGRFGNVEARGKPSRSARQGPQDRLASASARGVRGSATLNPGFFFVDHPGTAGWPRGWFI